MRALICLIATLAAALGSGTARAGCDIGGREVPCSTRSGEYRIRLPEGGGPYPAVVYLYGSMGNSRALVENRGFVQAFVARGYAVIVPSGQQVRYVNGVGTGWALRNARMRKRRDDIAFVAEVLDDAAVRHRIDRSRVLIAGMSNGAFLTWEIACHRPELGSAYAPVAGGYLGNMPAQCAAPVRILHTHGLADRVVSVDGSGRRISGGARIMLLRDTMARIAASNSCTDAETTRFREYARTTWSGCQYGASVDLLLHKGGHTVPFSWFSTVIDWFEGAPGPRRTGVAVGGGTPRFKRVGGGAGRRIGGRLPRATSSGRFKRPTVRRD